MDNSFHEDSALHVSNDYYSYGGITRPLVVEEIGDMFIKHIHFIPFLKDDKWHASIRATVTNLTNEEKNITLQIKLGEDNVVSFEKQNLLPDGDTH